MVAPLAELEIDVIVGAEDWPQTKLPMLTTRQLCNNAQVHARLMRTSKPLVRK